MSKKTSLRRGKKPAAELAGYDDVLTGIVELLETARRTSARAVNAVMTATYWEVGRRIVEGEQQGAGRADYGTVLLKRLGSDLTKRFGRGFSWRNLYRMRLFYLAYANILPTASAKSDTADETRMPSRKLSTASAKSPPFALLQVLQSPPEVLPLKTAQTSSAQSGPIMPRFPLSWSHYVKLLSVQDPEARAFYETEALRGGWTVRQLNR
jgi:hypothetical protein